MPAQRRIRKGFTLIELLVVVAIIALLISILLPSLARARAQTRSVVCQSQLREYGRACMYYLDDYQDIFPPHRHDIEGSLDGRGFPHWFHLLDWYWLGEYKRPLRNVPLNERELRLARCPELNADHDDGGDWSWNYTHADIGYGYNAFWLGLYAWWDTGDCDYFPNAMSKVWTKTSDIRRSAECILFADSHPAGGDRYGQYSSTLFYPYIAGNEWVHSLGEGVSTRHMSTGNTVLYRYGNFSWNYGNGWGNCCFVDGHVEQRRSEQINRMIDCRRYWDPWQGLGGLYHADEEEFDHP
jgi:prepilin-type N-terminal cleavage/methylation domain-containing protein/prepilin-type processing-associated H-X9-DG protein